MTLEDAAKSLQTRLQGAPWLTAVGVGEDAEIACIVVYVKNVKDAELGFLKGGWQGHPVIVRKMGSPRLVASFWPHTSKRLGKSG